MSSKYNLLCLSHTPPLAINYLGSITPSDDYIREVALANTEHGGCLLAAVGGSDTFVEIWLPDDSQLNGSWYDMSWIYQSATVAVSMLHFLISCVDDNND